MNINQLTILAVNGAIAAGKEILEVYNGEDFDIKIKKDKSPLTIADIRSNQSIKEILKKSDIPVLSEEGKEIAYAERKNWKIFWLVDPLDGTKEFIKKNGEFTVNIALIENNYPIAGVVYVPVNKELYYANTEAGAYKITIEPNEAYSHFEKLLNKSIRLPFQKTNKYTVVGSRSHMSDETLNFINKLKEKQGDIEIVSKGSALKLCLVAEGKADIYPRFGPTMEWDTAAGHAIVKFSGAKIYHTDKPDELIYNKKSLLNPFFIVERK